MKNLILLVCLFAYFSSFSQKQIEPNTHSAILHSCSTPELHYENKADIIHDNRIQQNLNAGYTQWPMRVHIITKSDGTGGISLDDINKDVANINFIYSDINLEWYIASVNYIASDLYYDFVDTTGTTNLIDITNAHLVDDAVNVFFTNSILRNGGTACGFASYPYNGDNSLRIFMDNQCTGGVAQGTFSHEFGHHLNLPHTHNGTENGNNSSNAEHVPRTGTNSNCSTNGDYICDTEADPRGSTTNCVYSGSDVDIFGNPYTPPIDNIMSYYPDGCGGILTPGQYNRCNNAVTDRLGHTAYDIDGAPFSTVTNPSNLSLVMNGVTNIDLSWTDNANNETGYLIERSINGGSFFAFEQAGVGPNISTFSDTDNLVGNTTYCYRVKASNDNPDHYSNTTCVTTPNIICGNVIDLLFQNDGLVLSPFNILGIPTTIPSCQTTVPIAVTLVGDFGSSFENVDILGEDGTTVLGTSGESASDCDQAGVTVNFNLSIAQYNLWAANGAITLAVAANANVNPLCNSSGNTVVGCADITVCPGNCPDDFDLSGTQTTTEDFETDGYIHSSQSISGNITVDYDSGTYIDLLADFNVNAGTIFHAFIDGCD